MHTKRNKKQRKPAKEAAEGKQKKQAQGEENGGMMERILTVLDVVVLSLVVVSILNCRTDQANSTCSLV